MKDYVIVTDSTADLPSSMLAELGVVVIPMEFIMEEKVYSHYTDAREMSYEEFYKNVRNGKKVSTTQINYFTYENIFRPILESGVDILYIGFSSGLSGTYQASTLVVADLQEEFPEREIITIDSLSASVGEGLLVYLAGMKKKAGIEMQELSEWVCQNHLNMCHWFVVDDLHHLKAGGRITAIQATLGTALNLKPMLTVDNEGKLISTIKIRGTKRIIEAFVERFMQDAGDKQNQTVVIGHASNIELAVKLKEKLLELKLVADVIVTDIGPIIGTHVGAGMVALAFWGQRGK